MCGIDDQMFTGTKAHYFKMVTYLIINLLSVYVFLSVSFSALQTTQPPKVLFPPERQDTVIEITPGKDQHFLSIYCLG